MSKLTQFISPAWPSENYIDTGIANAYVLNAPVTRSGIQVYEDGLVFAFLPLNGNSGACTADVEGLGAVSIKLRGGTVDPVVNTIRAGQPCILTYRTSPSAHLEVSRAGRVVVEVITASDPAWVPEPDAVSIKFTSVGGGGGGGGVDGQGVGFAGCGNGGGAGAVNEITIDNTEPSYEIVIGAAGLGGAAGANAGTDGGDTSVTAAGVPFLARGGTGGNGFTAVNVTTIQGGAQGGIAGFGNISSTGGESTPVFVVGGNTTMPSTSGSNIISANGLTPGGTANGKNAGPNQWGLGGGGAMNNDTVDNYAGGDGGPGVVIATQYLG